MREIRAASRADRMNQVIMAFHLVIEKGYGDELTAYDIARKIGMRAQSPSFRDVLKHMMDMEILKCREVQTKSTGVAGGKRYYYSLTAHNRPEPRRVNIKKNGKVIDQMRLF